MNPAQYKKILQVAKKCKQDFLYFADKFLRVQTTRGTIAPFRLNKPQVILHDILENHIKPKRPVRIIALKARRMGFSSYFSGRFYSKTAWNKNRYATQITHEPEATEKLFEMVKRFYDFSPPYLRPETKYNNKKQLDFNTKDGQGLNSGFRVATAAKEDFGSGQLLHYCHLCMAPDTPVILADGKEKPIIEVNVGDRVVTHTGKAGTVVCVSLKKAADLPDQGETVVVTPWLGEAVEMTPQHKVFTSEGWVEAKDLDPKIHLLSMPIRKIVDDRSTLPVDTETRYRPQGGGASRKGLASFPLNRETGFFVGYYLAEGCLCGRTPNGMSRITFAFGPGELPYAERAAKAVEEFHNGGTHYRRKDSLTETYTINSMALAGVLEKYFGRKDDKYIPDWVFNCGEEFCRGLVIGYFCGDSSKHLATRQNYVSHSLSVSSIRESLAYQVRDLVAALGYGWGSVRSTEGGERYGRNCQKQWTLLVNGSAALDLRRDIGLEYREKGDRSDRTTKYTLDREAGFVWIKIKAIESGHCDLVVDLAIDHEDHSFRTPHFAVSNSEVAKWDQGKAPDLLTAILQCVPNDRESEVVFESTAKGVGGEFYDRFWGARYRIWVKRLDDAGEPVIEETINENSPEDNIYTSIFLPWFCFEEYQMAIPKGFKLTPAEEKMKKDYGLSDDQLFWRRWCVANNCDGREDLFDQEYPISPEVAFLSSGRPVFDNIRLNALKEHCPKPGTRMDYEFSALSGSGWYPHEQGRLKVWEPPKAGECYIVGADVAEGLVHGDYSVAEVINHRTGVQVAEWHGKCDPDQFARLLYGLGNLYNTAWLAPERNNHGLMVVTLLANEFRYPRLYVEHIPEPPGKPRPRYGWMTTNATRPKILDNLIREVREGIHGIRSVELLDEMMCFKVQDNGKMEADPGRHDDRVLAFAIAKEVRTLISPPSNRAATQRKSISAVRSGKVKISKLGWT